MRLHDSNPVCSLEAIHHQGGYGTLITIVNLGCQSRTSPYDPTPSARLTILTKFVRLSAATRRTMGVSSLHNCVNSATSSSWLSSGKLLQ
jgi:hypothetical protein